MTTNAEPPYVVERAPCPVCDAPPCRVETFTGPNVKASMWVCANNKYFGGDCTNKLAYLTERDWDDHAKPALTASQEPERDVVELIALLRREGNHSGVWFAEHLLKAAALIAALTASQEPLRALEEHRDELNRLKDLYGTALISHIIAALNAGDDQ